MQDQADLVSVRVRSLTCRLVTPCSVLKQREGQEPLRALFIRSPVYENPAFVTQSLVEVHSKYHHTETRYCFRYFSIVVERCHDQCKLKEESVSCRLTV